MPGVIDLHLHTTASDGDLVMETTSLVLAVYFHVISPIFLYVYLLREIVVLSARIYCAGLGVWVQSSFIGKLKSNFLGYAAVRLPRFLGQRFS